MATVATKVWIWLVACLGFLGGYLWGVERWALAGGLTWEAILPTAVPCALAAALAYLLLIGALVGPMRMGRARLAQAFSPLAFLGSFLVGTGGVRWALWVLG